MTVDEKNYLIERMNLISIEPTEPMNITEMKAFVSGYELAYLNILDEIDRCYRNMKTD